MDFKHLSHRFWHFFWFALLPLAVAWTAVDILDRVGVIEEVEVWYVLLLFALLAYSLVSIRDKLPFWQDKNPSSEFNRRRRRKDAEQMLRNVRKIIEKKGDKLSKKSKEELERGIADVVTALDKNSDSRLTEAIRQLDTKTDKHLAFAKKGPIREWFESIGVAVLVAIILRLFVFEAFKIPSESMVPTLMVGDHIFVSKYRYGLSIPFSNKRLIRFARPAYGEVVVFLKPSREEQLGIPTRKHQFEDEYEMVGVDFIKRIVGLPGDSVEMRKDKLFVNNKPVPRCRIGKQTYRSFNHFNGGWEDDESELWLEKHGDYLYTVIEEAPGYENDFGPIDVPRDQVFVLGDNRDNSNDSRFWGSVPFDNIKGRAMFIWWSNRRPHGFQWDRVGRSIMGPPSLTESQRQALARCPNMR